MNFFDHKDLGNHLLQLCPKVVKHPVYIYIICYYKQGGAFERQSISFALRYTIRKAQENQEELRKYAHR